MVVVDYSFCHDNYYDAGSFEEQRMQLLLDDNIANFCPRLRQAVSRLSHHRVGPLKQRIYLSDFQSSSTFVMPTDSNLCSQFPRNDMFVLSLPYLSEELSTAANHNYMVRWSIIAQCGLPHRAPEVILLGMDDLSIVTGYGKSTSSQSRNNQRSQQRQHQTDTTFKESHWQQFVANESFYLQCLSKWDKLNTETNASLQYCLLADQLYECYANFQVYKLKMSLKLPVMIHPPSHLVHAYSQYKQLVKLSKLSVSETCPTDINVELFADLDTVNTNEFEDCQNQTNSPLVHLRAVIKLLLYDQAESSLLTSSCIDDSPSHLVSVTATFAFNATTIQNDDSDSSKPKNVFIRILNPKLSSSTKQGLLFIMTLDSLIDGVMLLTDFVLYVSKVRNAVTSAITSHEGKKNNEEIDDTARLLFEVLMEKFCNSSSNDNCLLDYRISGPINQDNTSFIRFLLVDKDLFTENNQLKYILSVEYKKDGMAKKNTNKQLSPIIALRSVYDDGNHEHLLDIKIPNNIAETNKNELATMIETATINGMRHLNNDVIIPTLNRYKREQSSIDLDKFFQTQLSLQK